MNPEFLEVVFVAEASNALITSLIYLKYSLDTCENFRAGRDKEGHGIVVSLSWSYGGIQQSVFHSVVNRELFSFRYLVSC